ncbi:hypothetical protein BV25DRAFT_1902393 [Artomyces pyxidatus]|uniref:Uncharacterized protein n=1 Tax=Artomyces pyxidatus TaxID=48021 RepID=A0ACB8SP56_9AGAM|nr:hypothetical protein BV25DRAFT_1902393 [Artomyces pyxidatus]
MPSYIGGDYPYTNEKGKEKMQRGPIHRLPVETLREIFLYLPLFTAEEVESRTRELPPAGLAIYHVCRHWRYIVHKCRQLWTVIPLQSVYLTDLSIRLSSPGPIDVYVDYAAMRRPAYMAAALKALDQLPRVRVLSLRAHNDDKDTRRDYYETILMHIIQILSRHPASQLESFTIHFSAAFGAEERFGNFYEDFSGQVPTKLRTLYLDCATIPHTSVCFQAPLTVLELVDCVIGAKETEDHEDYVFTEDIDDFLYVLKALPSLERLVADELYIIPEGVGLPPVRSNYDAHSIELPNLQTLELKNSRVDLMDVIMNTLALPPLVDLHLHDDVASHHQLRQPHTDSFRTLFQDHFSSALAAGLSFDELSVQVAPQGSFDRWTFTAWNLTATKGKNATASELLPHRVRYSVDSLVGGTSVMSSMLNVLPMTEGVRSLAIWSCPLTPLRGWLDLFSSYKTVAQIRIAAPIADALLSELNDLRNPEPIFPLLQTISMVGLPWTAHRFLNELCIEMSVRKVAAVPLLMKKHPHVVALEMDALRDALGSEVELYDDLPFSWEVKYD